MTDILESIHRTNRLTVTCAIPARFLPELASAVGALELTTAEPVLLLIQDAITAAEVAATLAPVDASPDLLRDAYHAMRRPPDTPIATTAADPTLAQAAQGLDQIATVHQRAISEIVADSDPAQMPAHFRNALWQALACQDAMRKAAAAARQAGHSSLVIPGMV